MSALLFYCLVGSSLLFYYSATLYKAFASIKNRQRGLEINSTSNVAIEVSIIIPVRNEDEHIEMCIESILSNTYPSHLYEIIVVDDHSNDNTSTLVKKFKGVHYVLNKGLGKKQALATGVEMAKNNLILCTDGDSIVAKNWLKRHVDLSHKHAFTTGVVRFKAGYDILGSLQIHDNAATMCLTAYGIEKQRWFVANGANMSFHKTLYTSANALSDNMHIPSGDDVFLIKKAKEMNMPIGYLYNIDGGVTTYAETTWKKFWQQRKRWSSKTRVVKDYNLIIMQAMTFLLSGWVLGGIMLGSIISSRLLFLAIAIFIIKFLVDFLFLKPLHLWLGYHGYFKTFAWSSFIYLCYICTIGTYALFPRTYTWKERTISNQSLHKKQRQ